MRQAALRSLSVVWMFCWLITKYTVYFHLWPVKSLEQRPGEEVNALVKFSILYVEMNVTVFSLIQLGFIREDKNKF